MSRPPAIAAAARELEAVACGERGSVPTPSPLRFRSAAELRHLVPERPPYVWDGYLASSAITFLAAKPKVGKTTLAAALTEAIVTSAGTFLGRPVVEGAVVYVSEEGRDTLLRRLPAHERIRVLTREDAWPKPSWADLIAAASEEARQTDAAMVVIDTFAHWAALARDAEKDAGAITAAMGELAAITHTGAAVLLPGHQRKGGGEHGEAIRGSTALAASADMLLELERIEGGSPCQRQLMAIGRWEHAPPLLLIERDSATGAWRAIAQGASREEASSLGRRERLLRAVPTEPPGATYEDLEKALGEDRRKWHGELENLLAEGHITRTGGGKKGDPYRHVRPPKLSVPEIPSPGGTETVRSGGREIPSPPSCPRRGRADGINPNGNTQLSVRDGKPTPTEAASLAAAESTFAGSTWRPAQ